MDVTEKKREQKCGVICGVKQPKTPVKANEKHKKKEKGGAKSRQVAEEVDTDIEDVDRVQIEEHVRAVKHRTPGKSQWLVMIEAVSGVPI